MNTPFDIARTHLGIREIPGKKNHPLILRWLRRLGSWITNEETPWCSAFVDACAAEAGYERTGKLNARSWLSVGEKIPASLAKPGDVVILSRGDPAGWQGHVGFLNHYDRKGGLLYLLGGNQGNAVSITAYDAGRLLGIRRLRTLDQLQGSSSKI